MDALIEGGGPILLRLGVALAVGLIIGFERGWERRAEPPGSGVAGVRTFALIGLLGGASGVLGAELGALVMAAGFLALAALLAVAYRATVSRSEDIGGTTVVAALLTFALGALAAGGHLLEAIAGAAVTALLLGFKTELHAGLEWLDRRELQATLQLVVLAVVVLPLLPNRGMGPWDALNPRTVGLLVMLIAGISYTGYFAVRLAGERAGTLLTAVLGGLTSSTAVTAAFARRAAGPGRGRVALLGVGIALACATMAPRMLVEVALVNRALVPRLVPAVLVLTLVPLLAAAFVALRGERRQEPGSIEVRNPLELRAALAIGIVLSALFVLARGAEVWFGGAGVYVLALISGIADVDAIALALAEQAHRSLDAQTAARAIVLAAVVNTAVKAGLAAVLGGLALARWATTILLVAAVLATATLPLA